MPIVQFENGPTKLQFDRGVAPFGELELIHSSHVEWPEDTGQQKLAGWHFDLAVRRIINEAWTNSSWYPKPAEQSEPSERQPFISMADAGARRANTIPNEHQAWYAVVPYDPERYELGVMRLNTDIKTSTDVVGFAASKLDVSGNTVVKGLKKWLFPEHVYACVSDINLEPKYQGRKIGAALLYASLLHFQPEERTTTYVLARNVSLIQKLGEQLGYYATGKHQRSDLVKGVVLDEVRLEAHSVESVRDRLVDIYPWLVEAMYAY